MTALTRRHVLAGAAASVAAAALPAVAVAEAAVIVPESEIPIGQTLQIWQRGLPYIRGAVMRSGDWWYICEPLARCARRRAATTSFTSPVASIRCKGACHDRRLRKGKK
jgi:hypothetical protein